METVYLTVPGVTNSSFGHWQSIWEREFPDKFRRIEQTEWDDPVCEDWIETIEAEVQKESPENVVLVAHSLGCTAVAHWAKKFGTNIKGAFLVAPSDCEAATYTFNKRGFVPIPLEKLPFPSVVAASTNDEYVSLERAQQFADAWGSELVNVGAKGHINVGAGFGEWNEGLKLLKRLG
ncbi:MAG TPA: alpha/beta hydrolase [Pyrinomonadaceae bacterium]|nr:alpha/beta hydrolase [Pyrinomonadaceae bacterium]